MNWVGSDSSFCDVTNLCTAWELRQKGCAYYGKCAYYGCAYYVWGQLYRKNQFVSISSWGLKIKLKRSEWTACPGLGTAGLRFDKGFQSTSQRYSVIFNPIWFCIIGFKSNLEFRNSPGLHGETSPSFPPLIPKNKLWNFLKSCWTI